MNSPLRQLWGAVLFLALGRLQLRQRLEPSGRGRLDGVVKGAEAGDRYQIPDAGCGSRMSKLPAGRWTGCNPFSPGGRKSEVPGVRQGSKEKPGKFGSENARGVLPHQTGPRVELCDAFAPAERRLGGHFEIWFSDYGVAARCEMMPVCARGPGIDAGLLFPQILTT